MTKMLRKEKITSPCMKGLETLWVLKKSILLLRLSKRVVASAMKLIDEKVWCKTKKKKPFTVAKKTNREKNQI